MTDTCLENIENDTTIIKDSNLKDALHVSLSEYNNVATNDKTLYYTALGILLNIDSEMLHDITQYLNEL